MNKNRIMTFLKLVQTTLQTNHNSTKDCRKAIEHLLNQTDDLAFDISGERIVIRGEKTVTEALVSPNPLIRIK